MGSHPRVHDNHSLSQGPRLCPPAGVPLSPGVTTQQLFSMFSPRGWVSPLGCSSDPLYGIEISFPGAFPPTMGHQDRRGKVHGVNPLYTCR